MFDGARSAVYVMTGAARPGSGSRRAIRRNPTAEPGFGHMVGLFEGERLGAHDLRDPAQAMSPMTRATSTGRGKLLGAIASRAAT